MAEQVQSIPTTAPTTERKKASVAPIIIALVVAALGFFVITSSTSGGSGMFNYELVDLVAKRAELEGKDVKVSGRIARGSVRGEPASDSFRFDLEDDAGNKIAIAYKRLLPDPFEEGRDAIVQGRLEGDRVVATNLTVKCPSRYADTENMTEADKKRYYETDYRKHAEMAGEKKAAPAAPAAPTE